MRFIYFIDPNKLFDSFSIIILKVTYGIYIYVVYIINIKCKKQNNNIIYKIAHVNEYVYISIYII